MNRQLNEIQHRFFLAIIPPDPLLSEIEQIKRSIMKVYGCKAALRSPAHITIHRPFLWKKERKENLIQILKDFSFHSFECRLAGFGFFPDNKVVFIRPAKDPDLVSLYEAFLDFASSRLNLTIEKNHQRPFYPHITIAFRDINKDVFKKLFDEYNGKSFERKFTVHGLHLLEWKEKKWESVAMTKFRFSE